MKEYLFEMHAHTSQSSTCGEKTAEDVVDIFKSLGYDGIVITDHMNQSTINKAGNVSWKEKVDHFLNGYRTAKKLETKNFKVLLGMEIRFTENDNDYLVYGIDEEFIYSHEDLNLIPNMKTFRKIADKNGFIVFQAHPFRLGMTTVNPKLLDGVEVYNAHPNHNSSNDIANAWANKYSLRKTSGSDYHGPIGEHPGGLYFEEKIESEQQLVSALRNNKYRLRTDGIIK
ncbi:MAG: PHP domain-containing protein [Clostridia bacterium]|nr:PHP domain-containing protein [Clostridia bacterium]